MGDVELGVLSDHHVDDVGLVVAGIIEECDVKAKRKKPQIARQEVVFLADRHTSIASTAVEGCFACDNNVRFEVLPARERIAADEHWRVAHAIGAALPGWLVLVPRRHVTAVADLTDDEAAKLGPWQVRLSRALRAVTGCVKTYVVQFAEAEGFSHVHFHVIPRMAELPAEHRGPKVFGLLGDAGADDVDRMDEMAVMLTRHLEPVD